MARRLKFSTYQPADVLEPIEVELNETEVFYFKPEIPGIDLLDYLQGIADPNNAIASAAIKNMFRGTLVDDPEEFPKAKVPEDNVEAFFTYIADRNNHIDLPRLEEIANGVLEELAGGRPTESSRTSEVGSATNGSGRTVKRSAKAATSKV